MPASTQLALTPQRDPDCHKNLAVFKKDGMWDWICTCKRCIEADEAGAQLRHEEHVADLRRNVPWAQLDDEDES